jgi:hypothetical protein
VAAPVVVKAPHREVFGNGINRIQVRTGRFHAIIDRPDAAGTRMTTWHGGCHCGRIAFEVDGEIGTVMECNCSHCRPKGYLM